MSILAELFFQTIARQLLKLFTRRRPLRVRVRQRVKTLDTHDSFALMDARWLLQSTLFGDQRRGDLAESNLVRLRLDAQRPANLFRQSTNAILLAQTDLRRDEGQLGGD